jgi:hypothetical protein
MHKIQVGKSTVHGTPQDTRYWRYLKLHDRISLLEGVGGHKTSYTRTFLLKCLYQARKVMGIDGQTHVTSGVKLVVGSQRP